MWLHTARHMPVWLLVWPYFQSSELHDLNTCLCLSSCALHILAHVRVPYLCDLKSQTISYTIWYTLVSLALVNPSPKFLTHGLPYARVASPCTSMTQTVTYTIYHTTCHTTVWRQQPCFSGTKIEVKLGFWYPPEVTTQKNSGTYNNHTMTNWTS